MGIMQNALETYEALAKDYAGVEYEGKEPLAPVAHMIAKASVEVTINQNGGFVQAAAIERKIVIPCTQKSAGRTSNAKECPHPLCDNVKIITSSKDLYCMQLKAWADSPYSDPKIEAVLTYVSNNDLVSDLQKSGIKYDEKSMVAWRVIGFNGNEFLPFDRSLHQKFTAYYLSLLDEESPKKEVCMITGEESVSSLQHLKGIVPKHGNAKIVSANDSTNFTYRGRFSNPSEALTTGYEVSQKIDNALKWIVSNQAEYIGDRAFVCWNPHGNEIPKYTNPLLGPSETKITPTEYKQKLHDMVLGYSKKIPTGENVVIAAFDAATSGRLALAYYNELNGSDFLSRLEYWDSTCCWNNSRTGVYSPYLTSIVNCAFGTERGTGENRKFEVDDKVFSQHMQRLIHCRLDRQAFPADVINAMTANCSRLVNYTKSNRERLLFTACASLRKYYIDRNKEEWSMSLEPEKNDRSYQYGRLLAVFDKIENDVYQKDGESRDTNALKMQSVFVQRPGYASQIIHDKLVSAYFPKLGKGQRIYYENLIGQIMEQLSGYYTEFDKALEPTYLLGFYLQRNAFYTKKEEIAEEEK